MNMKRSRSFLTTTGFTASMIEKARGLDLSIDGELLTVDDIKGIEFISALKDIRLSEYLIENGVPSATLGPIKIYPQAGDTIYMVNPGISLHDLRDDKLPSHVSITITRMKVMKKQ